MDRFFQTDFDFTDNIFTELISFKRAPVSVFKEKKALTIFEATIKNIKKKAKKAKLFNIRVEIRYEDDTDGNLPYSYIAIVGDRLETEKEWQERLTLNKRRNERWIKEIMDNYNALRLYKEIDEKYEKALAAIRE
jgi:hypothetical protein